MINIEQEKSTKQKSPLEKAAPFVLIIFIAFAVFFFFFRGSFTDNSLEIDNQINSQQLKQKKIEELINFINSERFTSLRFVPDPPIFDYINN